MSDGNDGGRWRWDDAHEIFDDDFVDKAGVQEGDWRQREQEGERQRREAKRADRRERRRARMPRPGQMALIAVLLVGLGAAIWFGLGPGRRTESAAPDPTVRPATTQPAITRGTGPDGQAIPPGTNPELRAASTERGDCLVWDQSPTVGNESREAPAVDCAEPHLLEVAAVVDFADEQLTERPGPTAMSELIDRRCAPAAESLLGGAFDPVGRFDVSALSPTARGWAAGDRTLICGIGSNLVAIDTPPGQLGFLVGEARFAEQAFVRVVGTCYREGSVQPVDCAGAHRTEIVGIIDLTGRVVAPPAPDDLAGWGLLLGDECEALAVQYLGRVVTADEQVVHYVIQPRSWELGRRQVECAIADVSGAGPLPESDPSSPHFSRR